MRKSDSWTEEPQELIPSHSHSPCILLLRESEIDVWMRCGRDVDEMWMGCG